MVCSVAVNLYLWMGIGKQLFIDWHVEGAIACIICQNQPMGMPFL